MSDDKNWDRPGRGNIFSNKKKTSPTHPDYTGYFIAGKAYAEGDKIQLGIWEKTAKTGSKYLSIQESRPYDPSRPRGDQEVHPTYGPKHVNDDDVPF